jgi:ABC-type branched-subunit amino acid transport system ATPase component
VRRGALLEVQGVFSGYGRKEILQGVNLQVQANEIVCLIGPNGAGKSTVLRTILGYLKPRAGHIAFRGESIAGWETDRIVRLGMAFCPQGRSIFPDMTVSEHLDMGGWTIRDPRGRREARQSVLDMFPVLRQREGQRAKTMSGGERQMLTLGMAMMTSPTLLLLDEPTIGLAPLVVEAIFQTVERIHGQGVSVLVVEQNAAKALAHSQRGYVLEMGMNRYEGPSADLLRDPKVRELYLGGR